MGVVVSDDFTRDTDTVSLGAHTPTIAGTSYSLDEMTSVRDIQVVHTVDRAGLTGSAASNRVNYVGNPGPTNADYDVQIKIITKPASGDNDPLVLFGRWQSTGNFYAVSGYHDGAAVRLRLYKKVAGTPTSLGTDTVTALAANDVVKLEIRGTTLKVYVNGVEKISATDSEFSAAGKGGLGFGNFWTALEDINAAWGVDDFLITEVDVVGGAVKIVGGGKIMHGALVQGGIVG